MNDMTSVAKRFVDLKYEIDCLGRIFPCAIPNDLHGSACCGEYGPELPYSFISNIIPFMSMVDFSSGERFISLVPTSLTLGCSWRIWPDPNINKEEALLIYNTLNSDYEVDSTSYTYIPELEIYIPHEGKNRVNFCRYHGFDYIKAKVETAHYPSPDRLKIYYVLIPGGVDVWAVLDGKYMQKINHYAYALPFMRQYGVEIFDGWPDSYPDISTIVQFSKKEYTNHDNIHNLNNVINLDKITQKIQLKQELEKWGDEYVNCSLMDISLSLNRFGFGLIFLFVLMMVTILFLDLYLDVVIFSLFLMMTFVFSVFSPIFKERRKNLRTFEKDVFIYSQSLSG